MQKGLQQQSTSLSAVNKRGPGEEGAAGYCLKILLAKGAKMVFCSFHRSHREICTRNRPLSETKFLDDFWGAPSSPGPFVLLLALHVQLSRQVPASEVERSVLVREDIWSCFCPMAMARYFPPQLSLQNVSAQLLLLGQVIMHIARHGFLS